MFLSKNTHLIPDTTWCVYRMKLRELSLKKRVSYFSRVIDIISNKYSYKTMTLQIMLVFRDSCDIQNLS